MGLLQRLEIVDVVFIINFIFGRVVCVGDCCVLCLCLILITPMNVTVSATRTLMVGALVLLIYMHILCVKCQIAFIIHSDKLLFWFPFLGRAYSLYSLFYNTDLTCACLISPTICFHTLSFYGMLLGVVFVSTSLYTYFHVSFSISLQCNLISKFKYLLEVGVRLTPRPTSCFMRV